MATSANEKVLRTPELVILVLKYLDELSLVRSQGVNTFFHQLVQGTKTLRQRIGLTLASTPTESTDVIDTSGGGNYPDLTWNPLLDWFVTRSFVFDNRTDGPIGQSHDYVIFNILPHALRAAYDNNSSVHRLSIATQPVNHVQLFCAPDEFSSRRGLAGRLPTIEVQKMEGVSLGDMLKGWAMISTHRKAMPVALCLPSSSRVLSRTAYQIHRSSIAGSNPRFALIHNFSTTLRNKRLLEDLG